MDGCANADGCGSTCSCISPESLRVSPEVTQAAETLACLLTDVAEFQNFLRLARVVRLDEEVNEIVAQMKGYDSGKASVEDDGAENSAAALEERLEALPVMREYRQAEESTRLIFRVVEEAISGAAGVPFAELARPRACG